LLLERSIAVLKPVEEVTVVRLPAGSLTKQGQAVIAAVAEGQLPPGEGASLLASLSALAKLTIADELESRVAGLEKAANAAIG